MGRPYERRAEHSASYPSMVAQGWRSEPKSAKTEITALQAVTGQVDKWAGMVDSLLVASRLVWGSMEIARMDGRRALERVCWRAGADSYLELLTATTPPE